MATPLERWGTYGLMAVAAVGAVLAGVEPTANRAADAALVAGLAAVVVAAAAIARTWAWVLLAGVGAVGGEGVWAAVAVSALAFAILAAALRQVPARRLVGAAIGAVAMQAALRIPGGPFAMSALATGVAAIAVVASGWRLARKDVRSHLRHAAYVVGGLAVVFGASFGLSALQGRHGVEVGLRRAREGLAAARAGDTERAAELLDQASRAFATANGEFGSWWTRPARLLPVVGPQARALERVSRAGADLAGAAAEAARNADVQSLKVQSGRLDLERVASMQAPLDLVLAALRRADGAVDASESPWLLPPVDDRIDTFASAVEDALHDGEVAASAVAVAPALLGGEGPRHYLLIFATPAETRDLGGFMGGYGELVAENGQLSLLRNGPVKELNEAGKGRHLTDPAVIPARMEAFELEEWWQNMTASPEFSTVAEAVRQMWPQSGGGQLDGVLYVDPDALAALLQLTGPITVEGYDEPLIATTAADFLLRGQYLAFDVTDDRKDFLVRVARTVFDKLTAGDLPGPRQIADVLSPAVRGRRILLHSYHEAEQDLFVRLGVAGDLPPIGEGVDDVLTVRSSNLGQDKIDAFLERTVDYAVTVDPDRGTVAAELTMTFRNGAPVSDLPDYVIGNPLGLPLGTNALSLAVFSPLDLVEATSGGLPVGTGAGEEYGRKLHTALVTIPPGAEVTVVFRLQGPADLADGYQLTVVPQPLAHDDQLTVNVTTTSGWALEDPAAGRLEVRLARDEHVAVDFREN